MKRSDSISETEIWSEARKILGDRLPPGWSIVSHPGVGSNRLALEGPDGSRAEWSVQVKMRVFPKDIPALAGRSTDRLFLAVSYAGPSTRKSLAEAGVSYCDTTGNMRVTSDRPAIWIEAQGADKDPWRPEGPIASLGGGAAGRIVRALIEFRPPYKVRELAARSGASPATASRVAVLLEREAILERDRGGAISAVDWPKLLERWIQDYKLQGSNAVRTYLFARGITAFAQRLKETGEDIAVTGTLAVPTDAQVAPARLAMVYVHNLPEMAKKLGLTAVDSGANVLLIEPPSDLPFERLRLRNGLPCAALGQVAADLFTAPGRGPTEAEALIAWMKGHEDAWLD